MRFPDKKPINRFSLISSLKYKRNFSLASSEKYVKLPKIRENQYKSDQKLKKINKEKQNFYEIYMVFSRVLSILSLFREKIKEITRNSMRKSQKF